MEEKKQNSKKTRGIIITAMILLLIAIMCLCGTTFAKYITSTNVPTQQATVAKWGFVVTANVNGLFSDKYNAGAVATDGTVDVKADTTDKNVVAPGTKGSMTISVTGKAEVDAKLSFDYTEADVKEVSLKAPTATPAVDYAPVKWTLTITDNKSTDEATKTKTETGDLATVLGKLAATDAVVNIPAAKEVDYTYTLSWAWAFDSNEDADSNDVYDTILGYAADGKGPYENGKYTVSGTTVTDTENTVDYTAALTVKFNLTIKVEQTQNAKA